MMMIFINYESLFNAEIFRSNACRIFFMDVSFQSFCVKILSLIPFKKLLGLQKFVSDEIINEIINY